jgi:hypothetical protein
MPQARAYLRRLRDWQFAFATACARACLQFFRAFARAFARACAFVWPCVGGRAPLVWRTSVVILPVCLFARFFVRSFACFFFVCSFAFVCYFVCFVTFSCSFVCLFDRLLACWLQRMSETLVRLAVRIVQQVPGQCHGTQSTHMAPQSSGLVALCACLRLRSGR